MHMTLKYSLGGQQRLVKNRGEEIFMHNRVGIHRLVVEEQGQLLPEELNGVILLACIGRLEHQQLSSKLKITELWGITTMEPEQKNKKENEDTTTSSSKQRSLNKAKGDNKKQK